VGFNIGGVAHIDGSEHLTLNRHDLSDSDVIKVKLRMKTIDEFFDESADELPEITFVKIDVEGFEYKVLQGGKEFLTKNSPIISIEQNSNVIVNGKSKSLNLLRKYGYKYFF